MIIESAIPVVGVILTFLFVLLIILIARAPKVGVWVVGSLVLLAPILLWRTASAGMFLPGRGEDMIPVVGVSVTFLFILLVILLVKAPRAGAGLVVALVVMAVLGIFVAVPVSHRHVAYAPTNVSPPAAIVMQETHRDASSAAVEFDRVYEGFPQAPPVAPEPPAFAASPAPATPMATSPIWSDAIEEEFKADVYPSKRAAARAGGAQAAKSIRKLIADANSPMRVVVYQGAHDYQLIAELRDAVRRALPEAACDVEADIRSPGSNELGVMLYVNPDAQWSRGTDKTTLASGGLDIHLSGRNGKVNIPVRYTEKPWVESFTTFMNLQPDEHLIVARSVGTCMSSSEAEHQAMEDARVQLMQALGKTRTQWKIRQLGEPPVTATDIRQGGFIVDRFVQSFDGSAGRIWRQAILVDVSPPKLMKLAEQKLREQSQVKMTWARMGFSAIGVLVLIGVIYFFLNMATRGYYEWSLRIAGVVLAIVAVISVLMIVK